MKRQKPAPQKDRFAILPRQLIRHAAVSTLPPAVRYLLVVIADQYTGYNNGALILTAPMAAAYGVTSRDTVTRGLRALVERGLIRITDHGSNRPPRPRRYAVTWQKIDDTDFSAGTKSAPNDYCRMWAARAA